VTAGTLYIVSTPIGNMEDVTYRAIRTLGEVSLIAAEDTRRTRKLLARYGISTPVTSYFEQNERRAARLLVVKLISGLSVALVSDAGTPGISDPGYRLVDLALESGVEVVAVPGPSAFIPALSVSGLPADRFTFAGFAPSARAKRRKFLLEFRRAAQTVVVYDSPRRILRTLEDVIDVLGDIRVVVAREMTKLHEQVTRGRASEVLAELGPGPIRGEITLVMRTSEPAARDSSVEEEIRGLIGAGFRLRDVVKAVSEGSGLTRSEVYRESLVIKRAVKKDDTDRGD